MNTASKNYVSVLQDRLAEIEAEKVRLCAELDEEAARLRVALGDDVTVPQPRDSEVRELGRKDNVLSFIPTKAREPKAPTSQYKSDPLAAYRSNYERMLHALRHACEKEGRAVTKDEWWGELQKGSTRGGRAPSLTKGTFLNYTTWYANGSGQANGRILWRKPARGFYEPA